MSSRALRKALAALLLVAVAAFAAVGCGSDDDSGSGNAGTTRTASNEPVTLTMWDTGTIDVRLWREWDDAYMAENPHITIKRVHQPVDTYYTLIRTAIATQKGPDSFGSSPGPFFFDFYRGLLPLDDYVTPEDKEQLTGWDFVSAEDGTPYGVPWTGQGLNFYYNRALFEQAGLDPEAPPETWDDLLAACDALKAEGITPITAGFKDGYLAEWWVSVLGSQYMSDEELGNQAIADPQWNNPGIVKGFEAIKELRERECFTPNSEGIPLFPDTVNNFKAGKGAIMLGLSASAINWTEFRATKWGRRNLGAFLPPLMPDSNWDEQRYNYIPNGVNVVTKWSKHPQETYDYLIWLANKRNQETAFNRIGQFPNHVDVEPVTDDPVGAEVVEWTTSRDLFAGQVMLIRASVEAVFDKVVPQIVTGDMSIEDGMAQVQAEQDRAKPLPKS